MPSTVANTKTSEQPVRIRQLRSSQQSPTAPVDPHADALAGQHDRDAANSRDETQGIARRRERLEERERKIRADLAGEHVAAIYRRRILYTPLLTAIEQRYLGILIERGSRLTNIFPKRKYIRKRLPTEGKNQKRTLARLDQIAASVERKGFLRRWSLTKELFDDESETGEFLAGVGYQLLLPPGVITTYAARWEGPADWSNWCAGVR